MKNRMSIEIVGHTTELRELIHILKCIQKCGERGTHRTFQVSVDGDGSGRLLFLYKNEFGEDEFFPTDDIDLDKEELRNLSIGE
jgi:hypothetical protein